MHTLPKFFAILPMIILVLDAIFLIFNWFVVDHMRQNQMIYTYISQGITFVALVLWLLFLAPWKRRLRFTIFAVLVMSIGVFNLLFRVHGVTGDFVPIFKPRWATIEVFDGEKLNGSISEIPPVSPHDYPQFLGPDRNAKLDSVELLKDWSEKSPKLVWKRELGAGWSGFAIRGRYAVTQEQRGKNEAVVCYDVLSGNIHWIHEYPAAFVSVVGGNGPRATPTIDGSCVYTLGATGVLCCLELLTGQKVWQKDILKENSAKNKEWGKSCSPLIYKNLVVVSAGGQPQRSLVAYEKLNGNFVWGGGEDTSGYSSPTIAKLLGQEQIVIFNNSSVASHDPENGKVLWEYPWDKVYPNVAQPVVVSDDQILVSSGYGVGIELLQLQRKDDKILVEQVWRSPRLKAKFSNFVVYKDFVYGLDDGSFTCLDLKDGQRVWKQKRKDRYGHGQFILVHDVLLMQAETGEILLVEASSESLKELSRFPALLKKTWNTPAFSPPYLILRNDEEVACYEIPLKK